jgi:hypothetical protein
LKHKRKYRVVEIYFVLYLAAIIFLLPDKQEVKENEKKLYEYSILTLIPEKTVMYCNFYIDTNGVNITSIDSSNIIKYDGNIKDIDFKFEIKDIISRRKLILPGGSKYYHFYDNYQKNELVFHWEPSFSDSSSRYYLVKVIATGRYTSKGENQEKRRFETEFTLVMNNVSEQNKFVYGKEINIGNIYNNNLISSAQNRFVTSILPLDISIDALTSEVYAKAYGEWENRINVFGITSTSDMEGNPEIKYFNDPPDNNGTAELGSIEKTAFIIKGKAPGFGKTKVVVTAKFKSDKSTKQIEFYVLPIKISKPSFANVMYPEKNYEIDAKLPSSKAQKNYAFIKDKNTIIKRIEQGEIFSFKPEISQIGKVLTIERYIDDNFYDKYDIRISDYSNPIVDDISPESAYEVRIRTKCYGYYNGEKNFVRLELKGNAVVGFQPRGKIPVGDDDITFIQMFIIVPKQKDKPFNFEVKAVDIKGRESNWKSFSQ